jgi:hypothetical protein
VDEIGKNSSLLTMLGGKIVYGAGPYAQMESKQRVEGENIARRPH